MPSNEFKRTVRRYAAEHGLSYTTALREVIAQRSTESVAKAEYSGPLVLISPSTGCWRSWTGLVDFAEPLHMSHRLRDPLLHDLLIAGEPFHDDSTLELLHGEVGATRLQQLGAPTGSKHHADQPCLVCHADVQYATPTSVEELEHRCHQIRSAFEQFVLVEPGQGATVNCGARQVDGDVRLEAFIKLTDAVRNPIWLSDGSLLRAPSRLVGFAWSSADGWTGLLDPANPADPQERLRMFDTLLNWDVWRPGRIAATINNARLDYPADVSEEDQLTAELTGRARAVRNELEYLRGDAHAPAGRSASIPPLGPA